MRVSVKVAGMEAVGDDFNGFPASYHIGLVALMVHAGDVTLQCAENLGRPMIGSRMAGTGVESHGRQY
jgi:hypothetical protein